MAEWTPARESALAGYFTEVVTPPPLPSGITASEPMSTRTFWRSSFIYSLCTFALTFFVSFLIGLAKIPSAYLGIANPIITLMADVYVGCKYPERRWRTISAVYAFMFLFSASNMLAGVKLAAWLLGSGLLLIIGTLAGLLSLAATTLGLTKGSTAQGA